MSEKISRPYSEGKSENKFFRVFETEFKKRNAVTILRLHSIQHRQEHSKIHLYAPIA
jgi:hypothetical protein